MKILVIEDDTVIGRSLHKGLGEAGLASTLARDGTRGLELALTGQFDVLILDLLLPGKSGLEVLRDVRANGIRTPVILLTALGSVEERVAGLRAGADDYMVKPFALVELLARLEAVARRTQKPAPLLEAGSLVLDLTTRGVSESGPAGRGAASDEVPGLRVLPAGAGAARCRAERPVWIRWRLGPWRCFKAWPRRRSFPCNCVVRDRCACAPATSICARWFAT